MVQQLIDILHTTHCSLVVESHDGRITTHNQKGVRDLISLLDHEPERLQGAYMADKVIGKAAAALVIRGGVSQLYAEVLSRKALPLLDASPVNYTYGTLVSAIVIPEGDDRCPLEQIVDNATTADEVEALLRQHFKEMNHINNLNQK